MTEPTIFAHGCWHDDVNGCVACRCPINDDHGHDEFVPTRENSPATDE